MSSEDKLSSTERSCRLLAIKCIDGFLNTLSLYCSENLIANGGKIILSCEDECPNSHIFTVMLRVLIFHLRKVQESCARFETSRCMRKSSGSSSVLDDKMRNYVTKRINICIQKGIDSGNMSVEKLRIVKRVISSFEIDSLHMGLGWSSNVVASYKTWMVVADRENPNGVLKNSHINSIKKERVSRSISPSTFQNNNDSDEEYFDKRNTLRGIRKKNTTRMRRSSSASSIVISERENSEVKWGVTEEREFSSSEGKKNISDFLILPPVSSPENEVDYKSIVTTLIEKAERMNSENEDKDKSITTRKMEMKRARSLFGIK
jgi:hypothetical protein